MSEEKLWRIRVGQSLAKVLQEVILHTGLSGFEVVTVPDHDPYLIKVFRLDCLGDFLYEGSRSVGFLIFLIDISYPNRFGLTLLDECGERKGGSYFCKTLKNLEEDSKEVLLRRLFCYSSFQL